MRDTYADAILVEVVAMLKKARKAKGLSHDKVAEKAGITRAAISYIESGQRSPSLVTCLKIARAMDIKLWALLKKLEK